MPMSNDRKPLTSLVTGIRPDRSDRIILTDIARVVDTHTTMLARIAEEQSRIGQVTRTMSADLHELTGHVMRADAQGKRASQHDLTQDAEIAAIKEQVKFIPRAAQLFVEFMDDKRTKAVGRFLIAIIAGYAAARGWKVLP